MKRLIRYLPPVLLLTLLIACNASPKTLTPEPGFSIPTTANSFIALPTQTGGAALTPEQTTPPEFTQTPTVGQADLTIQVDAAQSVHPISPLIYGLSGAPGDVVEKLNPSLNSWGGNPSSRFNWEIGHAWNAGSDWEYRNTNYGAQSGSSSDDFFATAQKSGTQVRLAVPTIGWVAKNDDSNTCSFPLPGGGCGNGNGANCENPSVKADPTTANVKSETESIANWLKHLTVEKGFKVDFVSMDNEPELWGYTHYDIHPTCTTYQEILDKYSLYAKTVHETSPETKLSGPATCCWYFYWNSAAGKTDKLYHLNQDFLPWFLDSVHASDNKSGWRSLDVLDIHFYPEGLYNDKTDTETAAKRLRSTRSLWDPSYKDESWINEPIALIPRLKKLIDEHYPGTLLGISEWNWGGEKTTNGALAIADVLGTFGREGLYYAAYWMFPPPDSPGFYAFQMYTNYDGKGSRFGDTSVKAESSDMGKVSSYAAIDSKTGKLQVMLVNKQPAAEEKVQVQLANFKHASGATLYRYSETDAHQVQLSAQEVGGGSIDLALPPYSISLIVLSPNP